MAKERERQSRPEAGQPTGGVQQGQGNGGGAIGVIDTSQGGDKSQAQSYVSQPDRLKKLFKDQEQRILEVLPKKMNAERWIGVILALNYRNGKLQDCTTNSIFLSALQGAMLGLDFNPTLKQAYLIPRWNKELFNPRTGKKGAYQCTFMPGYGGLRKLALNSGEFRWIESRLVYQSEVDGTAGRWSVAYSSEGTDDMIYQHIPNLNPSTRGRVALAYAVAMTRGGHRVMEVMTYEEIEKEAHHKSEGYKAARSRGEEESPESPWVLHWGMQARKTVLKRLCGQTEMSVELAMAISADNVQYEGAEQQAIPEANRGARSLAERLGVARETSAPSTDPIDLMPEDIGMDARDFEPDVIAQEAAGQAAQAPEAPATGPAPAEEAPPA